MSTAGVPAWLAEALPTARHDAVAVASGAARVGDICGLTVGGTIDQPAEGRLVLVLDVDPDAGLASVMLSHTDFEIRTSLDVILTGDELGLPFDLALQTDLVGPVGIASLSGTAVGHVGDQLLEDVREAVNAGEIPASLVGRVGMPLRREDDARWGWKVAEGVVLDRLLAEHAFEVGDAVSPVQVLADALMAVGCVPDGQDPLLAVTHCLFGYKARREVPPAPVLTLLAEPPIRAALGRDMLRAIDTMLLVA